MLALNQCAKNVVCHPGRFFWRVIVGFKHNQGVLLSGAVAYYMLLSIGRAFGENGSYPPAIGMWMPNAILGIVGIYLLSRTAREKTISLAWLEPVWSFILERVARK